MSGREFEFCELCTFWRSLVHTNALREYVKYVPWPRNDSYNNIFQEYISNLFAMQTGMHAHTHTRTCTHEHTHTRAHAHTRTQAHTHIHARTCTYACTQTRTPRTPEHAHAHARSLYCSTALLTSQPLVKGGS